MLCVYIVLCLSIDAMPTFLAANFAPPLVNGGFAWQESEWEFLNPHILYLLTYSALITPKANPPNS